MRENLKRREKGGKTMLKSKIYVALPVFLTSKKLKIVQPRKGKWRFFGAFLIED